MSLYLNTMLGSALQDAIADMMRENQISRDLAYKILIQYDESMEKIISTRATSCISFKAQKLLSYRSCDTVWTLLLNNVEFREVIDIGRFDKVKIVAVAAPTKKNNRFGKEEKTIIWHTKH